MKSIYWLPCSIALSLAPLAGPAAIILLIVGGVRSGLPEYVYVPMISVIMFFTFWGVMSFVNFVIKSGILVHHPPRPPGKKIDKTFEEKVVSLASYRKPDGIRTKAA